MLQRLPDFKYSSDYCVIRIPLLPINKLIDFFKSKNNDKTTKLKEIYSSPLLQEAIHLASIDLFNSLDKYLNDELHDNKKYLKIEKSLFNYFLRSAFRCTPFGIFATVSHCLFDSDTNINLKDNDPIIRSLRIDSQYINEIIDLMLTIGYEREQLEFISNSSIYKLGKQLRYYTYKMSSDQRLYDLTSISRSKVLEHLISYGKEAKSFIEFKKLLINKGYEHQESKDFINNLINEKILVPKIKDHVSGNKQVNLFLEKIDSNFKSSFETLSILKEIDSNNTMLNDYQPEVNNKIYTKIIKELESSRVLPNQKSFIQINGFRDLKVGTINKNILGGINKVLRLLCSLSVATKNPRIETFKKKFEDRYGEEKVPLSLALDPDVGLGDIFMKNYNHNIFIENTSVAQLKNNILIWKYRQLTECLSQSLQEIDIDFNNLPLNNVDFNNLPDSLCAIINLFVDSNKNEQIIFRNAVGNTSTKLFGRFCHDSEELYSLTKKEIEKEEKLQPNKIFAEIVHSSQSRLGNVIARPQLRKYEIVYLGESSVNEQYRITIDDLFLRIINGELELWSKKLNKIIVPKSTTALNHTLVNLPVFQFLCEMAIQKPTYKLRWDWDIMSNEEFLPRVSYKNIVLSPKTWNMSFSKKESTSSELYLDNFLKKHKLPNYVVLKNHENDIILNIKDCDCRKIILNVLVSKGKAILKEAFIEDYDCIVSNGMDMYMNEIMIPFHKVYSEKKYEVKTQQLTPFNKHLYKTQRKFPPGSEWFYTKIYTGENSATDMLINRISSLTNRLLKLNLIDKWFFIRYSDSSGFHIRLRMHLKKEENYFLVFNYTQLLLNKLLSKGIIWNFTFNIYKRELERYYPYMDVAEEMFYLQSIFTISILKYTKDISLLTNVIIFAVIQMISKIKSDKIKLLNNTLDAFKNEFYFNTNHSLRKSIENDHRLKRSVFRDIIENGTYNCAFLSQHINLKKSLKMYINNFNDIIRQNSLEMVDINKLISHLIHMLVNRVYDSNPRHQEMLIYYNVIKYHEMEKAIRKNVKTRK